MICRLCLKDITEIINIFDEVGVSLDVAKILGKYFWFEPKRDDPISTAICNSCWIEVSNFNKFYLDVEEAHRLLTERFSIKTRSLQKRKNDSATKDEPNSTTSHIDETTEMELEFLLENDNDPGQERSLTESSREFLKTQFDSDMHSDENLIDSKYSVHVNDEESFDGEFLMDGILDISKEEDQLKEIKVETFKSNEIRRSTRSQARAILSKTAEKTSGKTKTIKANVSENGGISLKKRRGRPRKISSDMKEIQNIKKEKSSEKKIVKQEDADETKSMESKQKKLDDPDIKIANYMHLTCEICSLIVPTFADLRKHMNKTHNRKGFVVCCNKKFYKRVLLMDHINKHLNPDYFKCKDCDKVFADKQCIRNHILLKHQPEEVKTFACDRCPKKFAKPYLLEQHRLVHEDRIHVCDICQRSFSAASFLKSHIKMAHSNYGTMCDICAKVIRGRAAFQRHQLEHSGVPLPKVQCEKCGTWHKDKYSLQKHKRRHNEDGTLHVCKICGKVAPNRSALLSHHRYVHTAERTFECSVCKKAFKKAINLKEHMTMHTGEVLYHCPHCTKTFNSNANMHSHRKKMHPKEFEETRKNRLENASKNVTATTIAAATTVPEDQTKSETEDGISEMITVKTDDDTTHKILVTTNDFSDPEDDVADNRNIIYTVGI